MAKFVWRIASAHTIAYFIAGIYAITFLNYDELFNTGSLSFMRDTDSAWVAAGPGLQLLKGVLVGLVLYPFKAVFTESNKGWLKFWILIFGLSYILPLSAAIGSFEGVIYTTISLKTHFLGLPEILLYATIFSAILWGWYKKPLKAFNIVAIILVSVIVLLSTMGVLSSIGFIQAG
ncbi:MAG: hypothetical protein QNK23_13260 [Crocinitomicaceae bacterium]|nr:hypothetical protein [Crocinitomicaceae bacterium]